MRPLPAGTRDRLELRRPLQLGKAGDDLVLKLGGDSHLDVAKGDSRRAFGVEREEIERGADLARGVVGSAQAVLDKVAEEPGRPRSSRPGDLRPAHARGRQRPLDGVRGVVVIAQDRNLMMSTPRYPAISTARAGV